MGNSEVGHLNLGAGRVVPQTLVRIGMAVADGSLASNPAFVAACDAACAGRGVLHLAGLVSDGGVHSHVDHLRALVRAATVRGVPRVAVHAFTDGRDVSPHQAADLLEQLGEEWSTDPCPHRHGDGTFLRDGSRRAASSAPSAHARPSSTASASARRPRRLPCARATPAGSPTSSSSRSCSRRPSSASSRAIRCSRSTSARIACARSATPSSAPSGCSRR